VERTAASLPLERRSIEAELAVRVRQQAALADLGLRALAGMPVEALLDEAVHVVSEALDVEFVGLKGEQIPLDDAVADGAASAFTLCTIPGVEQALAEVRRVLKPGAPFHLVEHGLAPQPNVQKWQHRIDPIEKKVAGGCHLTRDPIALLRAAGFTVEREEHDWMKAPKPWGYLTIATARAA